MSELVRIGTRGSALALAQANGVLAQCRGAFPEYSFELLVVKTTGDKMQSASLSAGELPKGLFTKELEIALLEGQADLAVHSLKDLPTDLPPGLKLGAVTERADVRDVLIFRHIEYLSQASRDAPVQPGRRGFKPELSVAALPFRAVIGTGSTRRSAQLRDARPDLQIVPLRGNVGTRLRKLHDQSEMDAIVLAAAGMERLGFLGRLAGQLTGPDVPRGLAFSRLPTSVMLPCVGQAAIGLERREHDERLEKICAGLNHAPTMFAVTAERSFLSAMGGGCQMAVGAHARLDTSDSAAGGLIMQVVSYLGAKVQRAVGQAPAAEAVELGRRLAGEMQG